MAPRTPPNTGFGGGVGLGDVDGDGTPDFAVGSWRAANKAGIVQVFSGKTGQPFAQFTGTNPNDSIGGLARLGDTNCDGIGELAWIGSGSTVPPPYVQVVSPAALSLTSQTNAIPVLTGGQQQLDLHNPASQAGMTYVMLGSLSGCSPGFSLFGTLVPLNPDPLLTTVASNPNLYIQGGVGILQPSGSQATITLPPLGAGLAGTTVHHAYVVLDNGGVVAASNPVPVVLQ